MGLLKALSLGAILATAVTGWRSNIPKNENKIHGGEDTKDRFTVYISETSNYTVVVNGKVWLTGLSPFVTINGKRHYVDDGSLIFKVRKQSSGTDNLGHWDKVTDVYEHQPSSSTFGFAFKAYKGYTMAILYQEFYTGLQATSVGDKDAVSTGFPRFKTTPGQEELGFLAYGGIMVGDTKKRMGVWGNPQQTSKIQSGLDSGPLVLFNHKEDVIMVSPFESFMAAQAAYNTSDVSVSWGLLGNAKDIPAGFEYATIVFYGGNGVQRSILEWGDVMRRFYGKSRSYTEADMSVNYLGYWTDNGAYYYYLTEEGKNYEDTLVDYLSYAKSLNIPYRYVQYDSWWYPKGQFEGVTEWVSLPEVFPSGLQKLYNKLGLPVVAHNRFWSDKAVYAKQNGGIYNFTVEPTTHLSIPTDQNFWDFVMASSKKWGLVTYEQDWLNIEFDNMMSTTSDVLLGRKWLMQMGKGAAKAGLAIQYCMSTCRSALQSLEISSVTQARVTDDYQPGNENWRIGVSSILAHALGLAPFKDNFWSTREQPGNVYNRSEPNSVLQSVVSTLSAGPVGPGDKIDKSDAKLIMKSCNADGLLLKPSRPVLAIDAQIKQAAFLDGSGPNGEMWTTHSHISGLLFGIIIAAAMPDGQSYKLGPTEAMFGCMFSPSKVFEAGTTQASAADFSDDKPLTMSGCTRLSPCVYYTTPKINVGSKEIYIYGELSKWVPVSPQRVSNIEVTSEDIYLSLKGAVHEQVEFTWTLDGKWQQQVCSISEDGTAVLGIISKKCWSLE